jgi:hypothetical protein
MGAFFQLTGKKQVEASNQYRYVADANASL